MVRTQLRALLEVGINPLSFFDRDYKKYFYLAGARMLRGLLDACFYIHQSAPVQGSAPVSDDRLHITHSACSGCSKVSAYSMDARLVVKISMQCSLQGRDVPSMLISYLHSCFVHCSSLLCRVPVDG
jgi:hypothetical protein